MKKIAALCLALVIIFALVGCDVSTRTYRRYPAGRTTYDTTLGNTYGGAYDGTYRAHTRARTYNAGDGAIYDRGYGATTRGGVNRGGAMVPGVSPYNTSGGAYTHGMLPGTRYGMNTPANSANGTMPGATTNEGLTRGGTATPNSTATPNHTATPNNTATPNHNLKLNKAR